MKNWKKVLIGLIIIGISGAILGYIFVYNKPHRNYEKAKPDFSVSAESLFKEYRNNTDQARKKYTGKVIEISGTPDKIETTDSLTIIVFVMDQGIFGDEGIRCTMLPGYDQMAKDLMKKVMKLKGFCSGYNDTDIIMEKCSLIN